MTIKDVTSVLKKMFEFTCDNCEHKDTWTFAECEGCSYYRATVSAVGLLSKLDGSDKK